VVRAVHRAYVEAGSEAVHTNSFGGTTLRLGRHAPGARTAELNRAAVAVARASNPKWVIGDVGPSGEYLPPVGRADVRAWREAFFAQGRALAEAGADALHIETMSDLREALVALEALAEAAPELPVMVSLTFERRKRGFFTVMGDPLAASLASLARAGAAAVGANCSIVSREMRELAAAACDAADAPVVLQPNAGSPRLTASGVTYDHDPERFADDMAAAVQAGARAVGGCCGTDPRTIAALARRLGAGA
jgi:5-methyltetrahydrofolate--homocysteine methyltransferase